jgi:N-acetylmuramoyl-L-alanine amidase
VPAGYGVYKACNTTGTATDAGYPEHAYTWDVALRTRAILEQHGVRVILTRSSDTGVGPCVNERAAIESRPGVDAAVAIHGDGAPSADHGFFVCTAGRTPVGASAHTVALSHDLALDMHGGLLAHSGMTTADYIGSNGYVATTEFAGLNLSRSPTTFIEIGNMRNAGDASLQSSPSGRQGIADGLAAGLLAYLAQHRGR